MTLVTFTPDDCLRNVRRGCDFAVGYARINIRYNARNESTWNFVTTLFTIIFLSVIFVVFSRDTEAIVIKPIKKVV